MDESQIFPPLQASSADWNISLASLALSPLKLRRLHDLVSQTADVKFLGYTNINYFNCTISYFNYAFLLKSAIYHYEQFITTNVSLLLQALFVLGLSVRQKGRSSLVHQLNHWFVRFRQDIAILAVSVTSPDVGLQSKFFVEFGRREYKCILSILGTAIPPSSSPSTAAYIDMYD